MKTHLVKQRYSHIKKQPPVFRRLFWLFFSRAAASILEMKISREEECGMQREKLILLPTTST